MGFDRSRREIQAAWDEEWGRVGKELNPWWLGSKTANFEMVMGKSKLGWFRKSRVLIPEAQLYSAEPTAPLSSQSRSRPAHRATTA